MTQPVDVVIGGRQYRVRSSDPTTIRKVAAQVDLALSEVAGPGAPPDDFKVAVLAALNLTADHHDERAAWIDRLTQLKARTALAADRLAQLSARLDPTP